MQPDRSLHAHATKRLSVSDEQASTLGVQVAGQNWLVDMADISGVLPLPPLTPAPLTQSWFLGVANVRGLLYGVTDMAAYCKKGKASGAVDNRILLLAEHYAFNAALLVDCVLGLCNANAWKQEGIEGEMRYRDELGKLWHKLDVADLLGHPAFMQIGAE